MLACLPKPFGAAAAASAYSCLLSVWAQQRAEQPAAASDLDVIDWTGVPTECDPCCLLGHQANRGKRHGKTVLEQIAQLEYAERPAAAPPPQPPREAPAGPDPGAGKWPPTLDTRGLQKRWQVESFYLVLKRLVETDPGKSFHIVDFGCSTGGLLLPLASLLPSCTFTGVEMKPAALAILRQRAAAAELTNVRTSLCMIEGFEESFDIALALHACGNATDVVMLRAQQQRAAYLLSPCCVGKLKFSLQGGTSFSAVHHTWQWRPRLAGSAEEVQAANQRLWEAAHATLPSGAGAARADRGGGAGSGPEGDAGSGPSLPAPEMASCGSGVQSQPGHAQGGYGAPNEGVDALPPDEVQPAREATAGAGSAGGTRAATARPPLQPLTHPRSQALLHALPDPQQSFKLMAQVADTNFSLVDKQPPSPAVQDSKVRGQAELPSQSALPAQARAALPTAASHGGVDPASPAADAEAAAGTATAATEADGSDSTCARRQAAAHCALAKLHVELDRNEAAREAGFAVGLHRMLHADEMAKSDLLVGLPAEDPKWAPLLHLLRAPDQVHCL